MTKIADLRAIWSPNDNDALISKFNKIIRILSIYYLKNEAILRIVSSKKLINKGIHLEIRRILIRKLQNPQKFRDLIWDLQISNI